MEVARQVYLTEIKQVLEGLAKDKSTAPGGWTIEFFLAFFDLVGQELLEVVESRIKGRVAGDLNETFISLIPKCDNPYSLIILDLFLYVM